ncbi:cytochrome P450 [Bradyrhizobium sp. Ai1a-2]|uniref:cytochrome P450 n=1 Tax=Bradyrhizobium sp. Ai1a-2 TaxID=196490 RepID=UPI0004181013|nr:cytochrome P450 [Bradyrhizobium sp. Ai1a-2]
MSQRAPVADWTSDFDPLDSRWIEDPYPIWRELRQECPVAHTDRFLGVYLPSRYKDIRAIAYDPVHFSSRRVFIREGKRPPLKSPPITSDPPSHRAERKILLPPFTPAAIQKLEPRARALCRELLEPLSGKNACDGAVDYAQEIPARLIAHMLGISEDAGDQFRKWVCDSFEHSLTDVSIVPRVFAEVSAFFDEEIARRRGARGDDLISYLLDARIDGKLLSKEHINGTLRLLLFAGVDTTWSAIGVSLWHLATHPDDRKRLAAEPQMIPSAVEEFLRAYAPVTVGREIVKETEIAGCPLKVGEMVLLPFGAANRDPDIFPDAERVVIDRAQNPHAAFGLGIHRCIGATLARMEMRVALEEWLGKFPDFALAPGAAVEWSAGPVRGPRQLPLTLRSR